eukprot:1326039-Amorphochlora_amoeboformis.AAC.1
MSELPGANDMDKLKALSAKTFKEQAKKGCELNEFDAHRFLERIDETLSVKDMREFLRSVDIDFNKMVSLTEYLVSKYKVTDPHIPPVMVTY